MIQLESGEIIKLRVRKHWVLILGNVLTSVFVYALVFGLFVLSLNIGILDIRSGGGPLIIVMGGFLLLMFWINFFSFLTTYYFTMWVITDKRIIDLEQRRLFSREVATMRLDRIQDVMVEVKGVLPTLLKIGNLRVLSASEDATTFVFQGIAKPYQVKDIITRLSNDAIDRERRAAFMSGKQM